jgi:hypothetical protein
MSDHKRMLVWMALFVVVVVAVGALFFDPLRFAFEANPVFNGLILGVLVVGVLINFTQVIALAPAARWIEAAHKGRAAGDPPRLVAPLARVYPGRGEEPLRISTLTMRSLLDGVRLRLDESRDFSRYLVGLLILLGLLGTFWGLLDTIGGVSRVIGGLAPQGADAARVFDNLQANLREPLAGMGTAFSSSLFGLAGALALGLIDLQAGHAQNRFFGQLEEWLSARAHLPRAVLGAEGEGTVPTYIEALLEQTAESLSQMQRSVVRNEEERRNAHVAIAAIAERLADLTDQLRAGQKLLVTLAKDQTDLRPAMAELAEQVARTLTSNEEMRDHLRNTDLALARLVEEVAGAREEMPEALRQEARLIVQSLARRPGAGV